MAGAIWTTRAAEAQRMIQINSPLVFGLGVLVVLVSVLADVVGIGQPGFGYKQGAGVFVGMALIIAGVWWRPRR